MYPQISRSTVFSLLPPPPPGVPVALFPFSLLVLCYNRNSLFKDLMSERIFEVSRSPLLKIVRLMFTQRFPFRSLSLALNRMYEFIKGKLLLCGITILKRGLSSARVSDN
ncbi:hypothetical protein VNO77_11070 [Canavalia gladiata]|uniref:Uncharacterized protein n=1 Tax=Canavalia gladiata TaxID=3824 RepID=A0AAN9MEW8_CANGL